MTWKKKFSLVLPHQRCGKEKPLQYLYLLTSHVKQGMHEKTIGFSIVRAYEECSYRLSGNPVAAYFLQKRKREFSGRGGGWGGDILFQQRWDKERKSVFKPGNINLLLRDPNLGGGEGGGGGGSLVMKKEGGGGGSPAFFTMTSPRENISEKTGGTR